MMFKLLFFNLPNIAEIISGKKEEERADIRLQSRPKKLLLFPLCI